MEIKEIKTRYKMFIAIFVINVVFILATLYCGAATKSTVYHTVVTLLIGVMLVRQGRAIARYTAKSAAKK